MAAEPPSPSPSLSASPAPRPATAEDYQWFSPDQEDLDEGFCFTWVQNLTSKQVFDNLGAKELERIGWTQLVGSGDGQQPGATRYFFGAATVDGWTLMVEDNGTLGTTDAIMRPLSAGRTLVSYYRAGDGHGRLLLLSDKQIWLDFDPIEPQKRSGVAADDLAPVIEAVGFGYAATIRLGDDPDAYRTYCMQAAFALTERLTGIAMTRDLLQDRTYLLASLPRH